MALTVLLGGARSGKSAVAQALATTAGTPVVYLATATPGDDEMAQRIRRHRLDRPEEWETLEEPINLRGTLAGVADGSTVIIDCLTLWVSNMLGHGATESVILAHAENTAILAANRTGETIVVTNEVGLGIVPTTTLGRHFRDVAGRVNRAWTEHSRRSGFVIAGRILPLTEISSWEESQQ